MPLATSKMTPRIINYILCGMRHPTSGLSEDDLSRLTGSSSSSASCGSNNNNNSSSSSSSPSPSPSPSSVLKQHTLNDGSCESLNEQHKHRQSLTSPERRKHSSKSKSHSNNHHHHQHHHHQQQQQQQRSPTRFTSTYLPEFINPLEWQKSRKRKERLDSTSTSTQERKLQRSNSEELLPQEIPTISCSNEAVAKQTNGNGADNGTALNKVKAADAIRRVCSEDFQKSSSYAAYAQEFNDIYDSKNESDSQTQRKALSDENNAALANRQQPQQQQTQQQQFETPRRASVWAIGQPIRDMSRRARTETSPARSQRFSPVRGSNGSIGGKHRDSDDSECEHERRRSSERFCKTRAPPGRKASGVSKKSNNSSKILSSKRADEGAYKYDLSVLKYERRGFVSKKLNTNSAASPQQQQQQVAAIVSDHNDNNLIDFNSQQNQNQTQNQQPTTAVEKTDVATPPIRTKPQSTDYITAQEALPWERASPEDQQPILSRRYGAVRNHPVDNMETAAKLAKVMPYPHQPLKLSHTPQLDDDVDDIEDNLDTMETYRAFSSLKDVRVRDFMQQVIPAMMSFQTPDERLKQVNKRLTSLKKKLTQLEESFEARMGYRPSQAERMNDKYMKNVLAELSKLRKERHELKSDPVSAMGMRVSVSDGMDAAQKVDKMKTTLEEIEENLADKRQDAKRAENLDNLNAEQLLQEKTAVQHGLLYFEQLYGRPTSKEERDAARPLYTRYRLLKRMVSRVAVASGAPELPTILEHEAFEPIPPPQYSSNNSTDTTNTPSDSVAPNLPSSDDSTTTTTAGATGTGTAATTTTPTATAASNDANENISDMNIEQLWEQLDKIREEKRLLKRTIREYESIFEEQNGRKMLKSDRRNIEETYAQYKEKKAKTRLLQALIKKHISR